MGFWGQGSRSHFTVMCNHAGAALLHPPSFTLPPPSPIHQLSILQPPAPLPVLFQASPTTAIHPWLIVSHTHPSHTLTITLPVNLPFQAHHTSLPRTWTMRAVLLICQVWEVLSTHARPWNAARSNATPTLAVESTCLATSPGALPAAGANQLLGAPVWCPSSVPPRIPK